MTLKISIAVSANETNENRMKWLLSHLKFPQFHASFLHRFTFRLSTLVSLFGLIIASYKFPFSLIDFPILFRNFVLPKSNRPCPRRLFPYAAIAARFFRFSPAPPRSRLLHDYIENRSCASATASQPERSAPARGVLSTV